MAESQRKFKEGDKARVIKKNSCYTGRKGVISDIRYSSFRSKTVYTIKMDGSEEDFYSYELEKIDEIEPKKEEHKLSFEEGQIVTLLDGKKYEICKGSCSRTNCFMCSLSSHNSKDRKSHCNTSYIDNHINCPLNIRNYFKLIEDSLKDEKLQLPLKEGQVVTLLDGKEYEVCKTEGNNRCPSCSLYCDNCGISHIQGCTNCRDVLSDKLYFRRINSSPAKSVVSENKDIKLPLELGQIVTLLDGKEYKVCENSCFHRCVDCSLGSKKGSNCEICYIQGVSCCNHLFPKHSNYYFELVEQSPSPIVPVTPKKKEYCNFVKVTFTMTDFQPNHIGHHKRTII